MQNTRDYVQQKGTKAVQVEDNREKPRGFRLLLCERRGRKKALSSPQQFQTNSKNLSVVVYSTTFRCEFDILGQTFELTDSFIANFQQKLEKFDEKCAVTVQKMQRRYLKVIIGQWINLTLPPAILKMMDGTASIKMI